MMTLFKRKKSDATILVSPVDGRIIPLVEVPDPVFSQKMMGDGIAIECEGEFACAPADGTITLIAQTKHAFGMTLNNGIELLVHVGLETVNLQGKGFQSLVSSGAKVKKGDPILKIDLAFMRENNVSLITPFIIINHLEFPFEAFQNEYIAKAGETMLFRIP